ncbi:MAG: peptide-N-glycosidase F-related protein [Bacteroidetes bacterium]|nr:peptide-N-glycosidase F-related protein [Bacteroidota bacterium]
MTDTLNGKDNWKSVPNAVSGGDFGIQLTNGSGILTPDATLGAFYTHGGPSVGQTASRKTTAALPFDCSIGGVMELEVQIYSAYWNTSFGIGYDLNDNGIIANVSSGIEAGEGGLWLNIHNMTPVGGTIVKPDGSSVAFTYDSIPGWNTYKFLIDFDAFAYQGSVSLYAKRPNATAFTLISQVNNLNLGLTPGTNDKKDPAKWKTLFIHALGGKPGFDNIKIRQPNTGGLQYQYIIFNSLPAQMLSTHAPFVVHATTNKNLAVSFTVSGPATLSNDSIVTLIGDTGIVTITAHQPGNATVAAAADLPLSIKVINPTYVFPALDIKNPVNGAVVRAPHLDKIPISLTASINYNSLLSVNQVYLTINSQNYYPDSIKNGYYLYYWTPPSYGSFTISATAVSSGGPSTTKTFSFQVVQDSSSINYTMLNAVHFADINGQNLDTTLILPSFTGTYKKITAYLQYDCPPEGCEAWDVIGNVNIRGANGEFVELLRYITPYSVACHDSVDITDFASQLQGKIDVQANFPAKSKITLNIIYQEGASPFKYSWMEKLWLGSYGFGGWGSGTNGFPTVQPVEIKNLNLSNSNITAAYLRLVTTGHGSGTDNTANAAEFYNATHHIKLNGNSIYNQNLWRSCNPNPAACMPQNGTWNYPRAGWCPGSIPMLWEVSLASALGSSTNLQYEFDPSYVNLCSAANPNCVNGVTCTSCAGGAKPNYMVAGELVTFYGGVPAYNGIENISDIFNTEVYPNPSNGLFNLSSGKHFNNSTFVTIYDVQGSVIKKFIWKAENTSIDLSGFSKGIYIMKINNNNGFEIKKLIIQ